jgi:hypothetical protein
LLGDTGDQERVSGAEGGLEGVRHVSLSRDIELDNLFWEAIGSNGVIESVGR